VSSIDAEAALPSVPKLRVFADNWLLLLELALIVAVVNLYQIEGAAFSRVMTLAAGGFLVGLVLPTRHQLPFFVSLSLGGIFWVLGVADGAWLVLLGLMLLGIAHLPVPVYARVCLLLAAAAGLAALRAGVQATPWSSAVWPILGSMFMFRVALYLRALAAGQAQGGVWNALAYFFMLPNVAFPLFPVVDYQTFIRTHYDRDARAIHEQGLLWISRGLLHLVIYRLIYFNALEDPVDVVALGDLVQYMLATFLLYLRVSGQFHLIVGVLHLFGFRLPETHKLYYLGHSFTELWRRINIYWTDFMMKMVFYPIYFKVKRLGPVAPIVVATAAVFIATWILHSYQWFWLRGGFPLTAPDVLFWGILGVLVIRAALKELKAPKATRQSAHSWSWRLGLKAATTFSIFCFLWSLWSSESLGQWLWLLNAAGNVDARGVLLAAATFGLIFVLGGWNWGSQRKTAPRWEVLAHSPATRTLVPLVGLLVLGLPVLQGQAPGHIADMLRALQSTNLNARDAALQHRGYYEQLDVRGQLNALDARPQAPSEWQTPAEVGIIRERSDHLSRDLHPSMSVVWNGNRFSTNQFGMRDQPYERQKPANTFRIALLGPSHVMGNGVADGETFEALLESRLNRDIATDNAPRFEILNFGVDGYALLQQLAILEDRVLGFSPDMVIVTTYHQNALMTDNYLFKLLRTGARYPDDDVQRYLDDEGLPEAFKGSIPVPYAWAREAVRSLGIEPRMLQAEANARVRRIVGAVNDRALERIAEFGRSTGIAVAILGLDAVIENAPRETPNQSAIEREMLPVIDLFDVFAPERRAELRVAPWDDHPNAEGHRLIAERLFDKLVPLLPEASKRSATNTAAPGGA
jgi:D-alanyl-lipoteichoic acid acyltransferase DltB (MBOAT superfamily)